MAAWLAVKFEAHEVAQGKDEGPSGPRLAFAGEGLVAPAVAAPGGCACEVSEFEPGPLGGQSVPAVRHNGWSGRHWSMVGGG